MPLNSLQGRRLLILAHESENNSAVRETLQGLLEIDEGFANRIVTTQAQFAPSHLAHHPAP